MPRARVIAAAACAGALLSLPAMAAAASPQQSPPDATADVGVARDTAGLQAFARSVSTPGSPDYREYLTIPQVAARFGASPAAVRAVRARLAKAGYRNARLDVTRGFLTVDVPAQGAQELRRVAGSLGALVTGVELSTRPPTPNGIANTPTPGGWPSRTGTAAGCAEGTSIPVPRDAPQQAQYPNSLAYVPNQFQTAFGFAPLHRQGIRGQGSHVAVLQFGAGYKPSDITAFARCFGLGTPDVRTVLGDIPVPNDPALSSGTAEATLDIQSVITGAPDARVSVVEGSANASTAELFSLALDARRMGGLPDAISSSYGICEFLVQVSQAPGTPGSGSRVLADWVAAAAAASGVSLTVATGDSGAQSCAHDVSAIPVAQPDLLAQVATNWTGYPASSPWITGVGGTDMVLRRNNTLRRQWAWNDRTTIGLLPMAPGVVNGTPVTVFPAGGGTGGPSQFYPMPWYQAGVGIPGARRKTPDVSMFAARSLALYCSARAPQSTGLDGPGCPPPIVGDGWFSVAGTSFASPLLAGGIALANQVGRRAGTGRLGFLNPLLYIAGAVGAPAVRDVTLGNNDVLDTRQCCWAAPGYDMATGLGTVDIAGLAALGRRTAR